MTDAKILLLDIENSAHNADVWGLFNQDIGLNMLRSSGHVMCFASQWYDQPKVGFYSDFHDGHEDMIRQAWMQLDEADIAVHYNGNRHDVPHLNREFYKLGLGPPSPYKNVDLYLTFRSVFKFASNKLEHVLTESGMPGKVKHAGYSLWLRCLEGDPKAWADMKRYCVGDVKPLRDLYDRVRPWIKNHPNIALYAGVADGCPKCGSTDSEKRGFAYTGTSTFQQLHCKSCNAWYRSAKSVDRVNTRSYA